jgi:hypothetical protein
MHTGNQVSGIYTNKIIATGEDNVIERNCKASQQDQGFLQAYEQLQKWYVSLLIW